MFKSSHPCLKIFAVVMPPYLTVTTAKVKIKLQSYFFVIPMAVDCLMSIQGRYRYLKKNMEMELKTTLSHFR